MKKGEILECIIEELQFPNKGIGHIEGKKAVVKNVIPGQKIRLKITKNRADRIEGQLLTVVEKAPYELAEDQCVHFSQCGGCAYQNLPYEEQLKLKGTQVARLLGIEQARIRIVRPASSSSVDTCCAQGPGEFVLSVFASPAENEYRNKMEFTFGDAYKGGPLTLGQHKRGSFYDILNVPQCRIIDDDFRMILTATHEFFASRNIAYYHRSRHDGILRHLLVRKARKTGEILVVLVAAGEMESVSEPDGTLTLHAYAARIMSLPLQGTPVGVLYTKNDSLSDTIRNDGTTILCGRDYIMEELLGLHFKITPFSFFQTNSAGAGVLYTQVRRMITAARQHACEDSVGSDLFRTGSDAEDGGRDPAGPVVFDLYSGTGTIAQILAPAAGKVIGVEIVPEAVEAARENAALNGLNNCEFFCGDVLKVLDEIPQKPDYIILDPPRDGVHPKALKKIIAYGVPQMVYISCKPTSLARDLEILRKGGYEMQDICCVDMFPATSQIETVCLLSNRNCASSEPKSELAQGLDERPGSERSLLDFVNLKPDAYVDLSLDMEDYRRIKAEEADRS